MKENSHRKSLASIIMALSLGLTLSSCNQKTSSSNSSSSGNGLSNPNNPNNPTPYPTTSPQNCANGTGSEPGIADSGQTFEYYKINNPAVVAHGAEYGTRVFNSSTDLPSGYNQNIFFSDSRFNVRVIPKYQRGGTDSKGRSCNYFQPQPFTKMNIGVIVRSRQSSTGYYYQFKDVPVNCPSKVREFPVPASPDPLVIEVVNVEWDWSCIDYENQGYPNQPGACPYDRVWLTECYQLELQFSTDTTKDIPGPRAY